MSTDSLADRIRVEGDALAPFEVTLTTVRAKAVRRSRARRTGAAVGTGLAICAAVIAVSSLNFGPSPQQPADASTAPAPVPVCLSGTACDSRESASRQAIESSGISEMIDELWTTDNRVVDVARTADGSGWTLFWSGPNTNGLEEIGKVGEASGIRIFVVLTPFSGSELSAAAKALMEGAGAAGIELGSVGPTRNYDGLVVSGPRVSQEQELQARVQQIADVTGPGIPIFFEPYGGPITTG